MAILEITPRFNDTDALGHINHSVVLTWLEHARRPFFKVFNPTLSIKNWGLIIARIEIDYKAQINYQDNAVIESSVDKIGTSSCALRQKVFQNDILCAECVAIMVRFDYETQKSVPITEEQKEKLNKL